MIEKIDIDLDDFKRKLAEYPKSGQLKKDVEKALADAKIMGKYFKQANKYDPELMHKVIDI